MVALFFIAYLVIIVFHLTTPAHVILDQITVLLVGYIVYMDMSVVLRRYYVYFRVA